MKRWMMLSIVGLVACDATEPVIPSQIEVASGNFQAAAVNSALAPVVIRVLDAKGKPAPGAPVTWTTSSGTISGESSTNQDGRARAAWTLPTTAGAATAVAKVGDLVAALTATAQAGPPTRITTEGDFQSSVSVGVLATRLTVQLADAFGNAVAETPVSWRVLSGGGQLLEAQVRTDVNGRSTAAWMAGASVDTQVVVMTAGTIARNYRAVVMPSRLGLEPAATNLVMGTTLRPGISFEDISGVKLGGTGTLTSSASNIAEVVNGTIIPRAPGTATLTARAGAMSTTMTVTVGNFPAAARGAMITADSAAATFMAQLRTSGAVFQFPTTNSAFAFAGPAPTAPSQVVIDAATGTRTHFPAVINVSAAAYSTAVINTLMIPRQWRIRGGTRDGQMVDISMISAFEPPCADPTNGNCTGFFPSYWSVDPKVWAPTSFPVPVAIHHAASTSPWSANDSIALWRTLDNMNADYGMTVFKPARADQFTILPDNSADGAILVYIDQALVQQNYGGFTNWWWNGRGELFKARVRLANLNGLNSGSLVSHEFLHALGHSHTCKWLSVMGGYGCTSAQRLTREDVGYSQLAHRLKTMRVARNAPYGLLEAVFGERLMLSEPSAFALRPDLEQLFARATVRAARGTDGAN